MSSPMTPLVPVREVSSFSARVCVHVCPVEGVTFMEACELLAWPG